MAVIGSLGVTAAVSFSAGPISSNIQIPTAGSPTTALITNLGSNVVWVFPGTDNTIAVSRSTGVAIPPGGQFLLTIGTFTYLAAIGSFGAAGINIAVGT